MKNQTLNNELDNSLVSNAFGFLRLGLNFEPYLSDNHWIITGVPFDCATSGRAGARFGASAIRNISVNLAWESKRWPWDFNFSEYLKVADCGDLVFDFGDSQDMYNKLYKHIDLLLSNNKKCLTFGGDHFISLPILRAYSKYFGKIALLHFDAHTDTYSFGSKFDHGTMFYHAPKEGIIDVNSSLQIGIRTQYNKEDGFNVIDADEANDLSVNEIVNKINNTMGNLPVYLTFDIDCLDPAFAPGTGTPVCGGLNTNKILRIIRGLTKINIVGMDIVEVSPSFDNSNITALAAATIALELLYIQAYNIKFKN